MYCLVLSEHFALIVAPYYTNRFFNSLAIFLYKSVREHMLVRRRVVQATTSDPARYELFAARDVAALPGESAKESLPGYPRQMAKDGIWGDELCIKGASDAFKRKIKVRMPRSLSWRIFDEEHNDANPVAIVHKPVSPAHYMFLVRTESGSKPEGGSERDAHQSPNEEYSGAERQGVDSGDDQGQKSREKESNTDDEAADPKKGTSENLGKKNDGAGESKKCSRGGGDYVTYVISYFAKNPHILKVDAVNHVVEMYRLGECDEAIRRRKMARVDAQNKKAQRASQEKTVRLLRKVRGAIKNSRANRREPRAFATAQQYMRARPKCTEEEMLSFLRKFRGGKFTDMDKGQALEGRNALLSQKGAAGAGGGPADASDKKAAGGRGKPSCQADGNRRAVYSGENSQFLYVGRENNARRSREVVAAKVYQKLFLREWRVVLNNGSQKKVQGAGFKANAITGA